MFGIGHTHSFSTMCSTFPLEGARRCWATSVPLPTTWLADGRSTRAQHGPAVCPFPQPTLRRSVAWIGIPGLVARTLWATCRSRAIVTVTSLPLAGYRSVVPKEVLALARRSVPGKDPESEPSERLGTTRCGVPLTMTPT